MRRLFEIILTLNPSIIVILNSVKSLVYSLAGLYITFLKTRVPLLIIARLKVPALTDSLIVCLKLPGTSLLILLIK